MRLFRRRRQEMEAAKRRADKAEREADVLRTIAKQDELRAERNAAEEIRRIEQLDALSRLPGQGSIPQCSKCGAIKYDIRAERRVWAYGCWQGREVRGREFVHVATVMAATCARCGWELGLFRPLDVPGEENT